MNVEYTGRQFVITPAVRKQIETGLTKLTRVLGDNFNTKVILVAEKRNHKAEITVHVRDYPIVGMAEANDMTAAIGEALERIDRQALKFKSRWREKRRQGVKKKNVKAPVEEMRIAVGTSASAAVPVVVHGYPASVKVAEAHIVETNDSVALAPMTLEEAVKECEFRDRDVFVFRDPKGKVKVLHRTKDGKLELIEAP